MILNQLKIRFGVSQFERFDLKVRNILKENKILSKHKVFTSYDIIIRNPWETEKDLDETLDLINQLKRPYYLRIYTLAYYPNHPISIRALREKMVDPKEVDATIGYLAVTTPHRVSAEETFWEDAFVVWHNKLRTRMLSGLKDESYFLLIAYHGFWFIPKMLLNFLYKRFKKNSRWELHVFSYLIQKLLIVRGYNSTRYFFITLTRFKQQGPVWVIKKIFSKVKSKFIIPKRTSSTL